QGAEVPNWLRISARRPSDDMAGLLAEGLLACGGSAVEEHGDTLVTYILSVEEQDAAVGRIREVLHAILGSEAVELHAEEVPAQDWLAIWRSGLEPRRVGPRLIVSPTWSDVESGPDDLVIRIGPQMAFGTGEHAATRGVLRLMQNLGLTGARLLDVGSGSAILSIAGALLGAQHVVAVESDVEAIPNARDNIMRSTARDRITMLCAVVD